MTTELDLPTEFQARVEQIRSIVTSQRTDHNGEFTFHAVPVASFDRMYTLLRALHQLHHYEIPEIESYRDGNLLLMWSRPSIWCYINSDGSLELEISTNVPDEAINLYYQLDSADERGLPGTIENIAQMISESSTSEIEVKA